MIHTITFSNIRGPINLTAVKETGYNSRAGSAAKPNDVVVTQCVEIAKVLENTHDHFLWIVTREQEPAFTSVMQQYDLEKYLVVAHRGKDQGTTNRNYPGDLRRLKVFIMKGAKYGRQSQEAHS